MKIVEKTVVFCIIDTSYWCLVFFDPVLTYTYRSVERGPDGAWQKFERGELPLLDFYVQFSQDLSDTLNGNKWRAVPICNFGTIES